MKKIIISILINLLAILFITNIVSAVTKRPDGTIEMKLGHGAPAGTYTDQQVVKFKDIIDKKTNGKIKIIIFPDSQLGSEEAMVQALNLGTLDMALTDAAYIANISPVLGVIDFMYMYKDFEGYKRFLKSKIFDELSNIVADKSGVFPLAPFILGPRHLITVNKPVHNFNDAKGLMLRSSPSELSQYFIKTLGGTPTPIPWPEVYMALKQGVVQGAEGTFEVIAAGKWHEVCNYLTLTGHVYTNEVLSISKRSLKELSKEDQKILKETSEEVAFWKIEQMPIITRDSLNKLKRENQKLQIIEPLPDALATYKAKAAEFAKDYKKRYEKEKWGKYYDRIVKLGWGE